ncbi:protein translocase subunit SecF [Clostridium thermarum]|uniref:protein translocase subunit SecF n=1 Tax=Clostridium thermarum TaxID=1716543 RepID=UPI00111D31BE|nr:protein translocase subunit SecF [Clostridium thermarum]
MLKIIERTKMWFGISLAIIAVGIVFLIANKGLNFGIDFKGGTVVTIEMGKAVNNEEIAALVRETAPDAVTRIVDETQVEIQSSKLDNATTQEIFSKIKTKYELQDEALLSENSIEGSIGSEMTRKAFTALAVATVCMLLYIRIRFKDVAFGLAAIIALIHDVLITLTLYAAFRIPVNSPFIAAMLTIIGYSINDTIVIFDRIRENQKTLRGKSITEIANISVTQTMSRSINTSLTTLFTIVAVQIFVPQVRDFSLPLIVGILTGAYSSIFIASPLWVMFKNFSKKRKKKAMAA